MELADIRRKALAARQFDVPLPGGITVSMRAPTKHESTVAYMECSSGPKSASQVRWQRALLVLSIIGWQGVTLRHVLPGAKENSALAFEPGAADLLLDAQDDWAELLIAALIPHLAGRQAAEDTAAKN